MQETSWERMSRRAKSLIGSTPRQLHRYGDQRINLEYECVRRRRAETEPELTHKTAMSRFYSPNVLQTLAFNRRWTLHHGGRLAGPDPSYVKVDVVGYVANLAGLVHFVEMAGLTHRVVRAVLIVVNSILLFMLQKYWGFHLVQPLVTLDSGD